MLLFYLQLGGCEPAVEMACGGLFIDCVHPHTSTHTHTQARIHTHINACTHFPFHPCNPTLSSPSCPIKLKNLRKWNETSKSQLLLWLTWYDLYYNLDPLLPLSLSLSPSILLPPTISLPIPFSLLSLLRLAHVKWTTGYIQHTYDYMYTHKRHTKAFPCK